MPTSLIVNGFNMPVSQSTILFKGQERYSRHKFRSDLSHNGKFNQHKRDRAILFSTNAPEEVESTTSATYVPDQQHESDQNDEKFNWKRNWYPVLPLSYAEGLNLDESPLAITILDEDLVLWKSKSASSSKDNGETSIPYSILHDTCPHRRAKLSTGKIYNETLACRYHGWEFDKEGTIQKLPMMDSENKEEVFSKAFCVKSYPLAMEGGLLWVYMDPEDASIPELTRGIYEVGEDANKAAWSVRNNPISWQSMIENAFDPSHAPFIHEGASFGTTFSPETSIPMTKYQISEKGELSKDGFALEHTSYQLEPNDPNNKDVTTRRLIAPITFLSESKKFNSTLHFVPVRDGETRVIGQFRTATSFPQLPKIIPMKMKQILLDSLHFFMFTFSNSAIQFSKQDQDIMQAQDWRKTKSKRWEDMYPTKSDFGVRTMQQWTRKFGRPPFIMPDTAQNRERREMSMWDIHCKYCPECLRTIKRISKVSRMATFISNASFAISSMTLLSSIVIPKLVLSSNLTKIVTTLFLSASFRHIVHICNRLLEKVFITQENVVKYEMLDVYAK
eukprot:CAMPEP_0184870886 /NCGR_PEP_ID=MMETSP0580-20130426/39136_1 /TAXON_ID=1118495 /ORGANISM="Dactyliosolen fragilissimus" /LENGTH=560 /DNA_ID=CAMNT_0027373245 /DNA_START=1 /DNA_END=1683 /DNA_ORIENTATION=+